MRCVAPAVRAASPTEAPSMSPDRSGRIVRQAVKRFADKISRGSGLFDGSARRGLPPSTLHSMLAAALRALFLWLSNRRWLARVALGTPLLRRMPLRFVAGTTLE